MRIKEVNTDEGLKWAWPMGGTQSVSAAVISFIFSLSYEVGRR